MSKGSHKLIAKLGELAVEALGVVLLHSLNKWLERETSERELVVHLPKNEHIKEKEPEQENEAA